MLTSNFTAEFGRAVVGLSTADDLGLRFNPSAQNFTGAVTWGDPKTRAVLNALGLTRILNGVDVEFSRWTADGVSRKPDLCAYPDACFTERFQAQVLVSRKGGESDRRFPGFVLLDA